MSAEQIGLMVFWGMAGLAAAVVGWRQVVVRNNPYGKTGGLFWLGMFVWGDAAVFGPFWFLAALVCLAVRDWWLFLLVVALFWLVRSVGETIYWLNQQFSPLNINPAGRLGGDKYFKMDSIWFVYQIIWQCVAVVSAVAVIYLSGRWLAK